MKATARTDSSKPPSPAAAGLSRAIFERAGDSARLLEEVFDSIPDIIGIQDRQRRMIRYNAAGYRFLGISPKQARGRHCYELIGRQQPCELCSSEESLVTRRPARTEKHLPERGIWLDVRSYPVLDERGEVAYIIEHLRDITERKQMENALRESEAHYHSLVENLQQCVFRKDREGRFTFANQRFCDLAARPLSAIIGKTDLDLFPRELAEKYLRDDRQVMQSGQPFETVESYRTPAGEERFVQVVKTATYDAGGQIVGVLGIFWDVTDRKRTEQELQKLASVVQYSNELINLANPDGMMIFLNAAGSKMLGIDPANIEEINILKVIPDHLQDKVRNELLPTLLRGDHWEGELQYRNLQTGRLTDVHAITFQIKDPRTGAPLFFANVSRDITERKQAEEEREKLQAKLTQAQKMESVGRLAGGVAHDFNNMLQAIIGNAAMALLDLPPDSPVREALNEIQKSAWRSADLTRQLLAFARRQAIQPKVLDFNETVAGMLKMLRRLIGENIDLVWIPGANLWPVMVDPGQIDQILANLCVNARDAIAGTGKVTIETANVTLDDTAAQSLPDCVPGDYVLLAVSDTGRGMDAETRSHLFEPFFTTKDVGKGTGLGLATIFGIVKQNRGLVSVDSQPGQGTTFKIYLPRAEAQTVTPAATAEKPVLRGTETVLLVEDEEQILLLAQRILEQHGYTVLAALSPEAALRLAEQHAGPIHLLITDVVMPGINGQELRDRLTALQPDLRCLFMSGYTADVIAHHGVLDEGVEFLEKPFTVQSLAEQVRRALQQPLKP